MRGRDGLAGRIQCGSGVMLEQPAVEGSQLRHAETPLAFCLGCFLGGERCELLGRALLVALDHGSLPGSCQGSAFDGPGGDLPRLRPSPDHGSSAGAAAAAHMEENHRQASLLSLLKRWPRSTTVISSKSGVMESRMANWIARVAMGASCAPWRSTALSFPRDVVELVPKVKYAVTPIAICSRSQRRRAWTTIARIAEARAQSRCSVEASS